MKKLIALVLALTLVLSATAFAATLTNTGSEFAEVKATYTAGQTATPVYKVDITWEGLTFTYEGEVEGSWNPENHEFDNYKAAGWKAGEHGTITVTNHSNVSITVTPAYTAEADYSDTDMTFAPATLTLETAAKGFTETGEAQEGSITVTPSGTLPSEFSDEIKIGTITVTIE